jgi:hypothetical protein
MVKTCHNSFGETPRRPEVSASCSERIEVRLIPVRVIVAITPVMVIVVIAPPVVAPVKPSVAPDEGVRTRTQFFPNTGMIPEEFVQPGLVFPPLFIFNQARVLVELLPNPGMMVEVAVKSSHLARCIFIEPGHGLGGRRRNRERQGE